MDLYQKDLFYWNNADKYLLVQREKNIAETNKNKKLWN
jgi:hypothetical protein